MKNELKISTLSIVCVLCAAFAAPAFAASTVRSLGGAGTYSSVSSAAAAKTSGKVGGSGVSSVRGGSVRVAPAAKTSAAGVTSSRSAATPRLSIGKYLAGASVIGGPANNGNNKPGLDNNNNGNLQERIKVLEDLIIYSGFIEGDESQKDIPEQFLAVNDRIDSLDLDVAGLKEDLAYLTKGSVLDVVYESETGTLVVTKLVDDVETIVEYPLSTLGDLLALEQKINSELAKYALIEETATKAELTALETTLTALIETKVATGDIENIDSFKALAQRVADLESDSDLTAGEIATIKSELNALKIASQDYVTETMLGVLEQNLTNKVATELAAYYTKNEIDALLNGAPTQEQLDTFATKEELAGLSGLVTANSDSIKTLETALEGKAALATVNALSDKLDAVKVTADSASALSAQNTEEIELLKQAADDYAVRSELKALAYKDTVSSNEIDNNAVTAAKVDTTSLGSNGMAIVQNTATGTVWRQVQIIDGDGNIVQ